MSSAVKNAVITAGAGVIALGVLTGLYKLGMAGAEVWAKEFIVATVEKRLGKVEASTSANTKAVKDLTRQSKETNANVKKMLEQMQQQRNQPRVPR